MDDDFPAIDLMPEEEASYRIQRQVAEWVSYQLEKQGKTQSWLADKMGKKQPYISRILAEGGTNITIDTAGELEAALGVPILETPPEFEFRAIYDDRYWLELNFKRTARRLQYGLSAGYFAMAIVSYSQVQHLGIEARPVIPLQPSYHFEQQLQQIAIAR